MLNKNAQFWAAHLVEATANRFKVPTYKVVKLARLISYVGGLSYVAALKKVADPKNEEEASKLMELLQLDEEEEQKKPKAVDEGWINSHDYSAITIQNPSTEMYGVNDRPGFSFPSGFY